MRTRVLRSAAALVAAIFMVASCTTSECPAGDASCAASPGASHVQPSIKEWQRIADAPDPARQEVAAAVVEGEIWVVGGLIGDGATDAVDRYDVAKNTWSRGEPLPIEIHHAMAAELNGKLFVLGGLREDGGASDRVFVLEASGWREGPPLRQPRGAGAAVSVDDEIIVVGGVAGGRHVEPVEIFDGNAWRDGASIPSPRDHLGAATDGSFVYAVGGRRGGGHFATFDRYDPRSDRWVELRDMPTHRSGNGAAHVDGKIVSIGGEGPRIFPEVEAYDISTHRWSRLPDLAVPVHGVGVAALELTVFALVGGTRVGLAPTRAAQVLLID